MSDEFVDEFQASRFYVRRSTDVILQREQKLTIDQHRKQSELWLNKTPSAGKFKI